MAVAKMRLATVTGPLSKIDEALELAVSGGNFHFEQAMSFLGSGSDFVPINDENPYTPAYSKLKATLAAARLEPDENAPGTLDMSWSQTLAFIDEFQGKLRELNDARAQTEKELSKAESDLEQLRHFKGLDLKLSEIFKCEYIKVRFGRLPRSSFDKLDYYSENPYIMLIPISRDSRFIWGVYFSPIDDAAEVDRIFQSLMWERFYLPNTERTPDEECGSIEQELARLEGEQRLQSADIERCWQESRETVSAIYRRLRQRSESFELRRQAAKYKHGDSFFFTGWVPAEAAAEFVKRVGAPEGIDCELEAVSADKEHKPPVKLRNPAAARPFEYYVDMYGLPEYGELDPTGFVAITYFLLFGMMFADVGQGFVLSLVGWIFMWGVKKMPLGKIIGICGISSVFFGTLLGSVFGFEHWLNPLWAWIHEKTGVPLNGGKLINIEDSSLLTSLIYATVGIGAFLVAAAMLLGIISRVKQGKYGEAIFGQNGVAGLVFYVSVIYAALDLLLFNGGLLTTAYVLLLIALPLLLIFLCEPLSALIAGEEDWFPKKPVEFLMQSFFELFEVLLSYVSNTVSFLRVGAFILVHYGMMTVVFTLAELNPVGSAAYIIVVVIGNIIVLVLEGLLVGIQALRLEFYEMFSRFYSGSGKPFSPAQPAKLKY